MSDADAAVDGDGGGVGDGDDPARGRDDPLVPLVVFLVLGGGLLGLFLNVSWFWWIWVIGFAVVLPMVAILSDHYGPFLGGRSRGRERATGRDRAGDRASEASDALETIKERYARGEIDEAEFERRLERLVENEDVADVRRRLDREREAPDSGEAPDSEREPEFET